MYHGTAAASVSGAWCAATCTTAGVTATAGPCPCAGTTAQGFVANQAVIDVAQTAGIQRECLCAGLLDFTVGVVEAIGVQLNPLAVDGAFAVVDVAGIEFEFTTGGQSAAVGRLSGLYLGVALAGDGAAVVEAL